MNREERKQFRKGSGYVFYNELMPKFDENGSYYEIKIYGDTPVECFSLPSYLSYIRKLQKRLPDYRFADIDKRKNLDRDAVYFLLREHEGLNFSEANKALVERFGFEPFTDHRLALDYIKRFKKFAKDESKNRNNSTEFDLNQLVNFNR